MRTTVPTGVRPGAWPSLEFLGNRNAKIVESKGLDYALGQVKVAELLKHNGDWEQRCSA
jgi:hypothetical protein